MNPVILHGNPEGRDHTMTITDLGPTGPEVDLTALDPVPPTLHESVGFFRPPMNPPTADADLFDVHDVCETFRLLNGTRTNGIYAEGGCQYVRYTENGSIARLALPDCIAGAIIALLAPDYFRDVVRAARSIGVQSLRGIGDVFTDSATELLSRAQCRADSGVTWNEAFYSALNELRFI